MRNGCFRTQFQKFRQSRKLLRKGNFWPFVSANFKLEVSFEYRLFDNSHAIPQWHNRPQRLQEPQHQPIQSTSKPLTLAIQPHILLAPSNLQPPNIVPPGATRISNKSSKTSKKPWLPSPQRPQIQQTEIMQKPRFVVN